MISNTKKAEKQDFKFKKRKMGRHIKSEDQHIQT